MTDDRSIALEAVNLSHSYGDGTAALDRVSFSVAQGERVALVGPNASGKTTFLMHLNGLLLPTSGELAVNGVKLGPSSVRHARASVGLLFQDPDDQLFMPSVIEDVAFGPLNMGMRREEALLKARSSLAALGLSGIEGRPPQALSGGQKRLAALAGLLAMGPVILALDEPTSGLDPRARRLLLRKLGELGQSMIVASHDLEFCLSLCSRSIVLDNGKVVRDGVSRDLFGDRDFMEAHGLERPHSLDHCAGVIHVKP